MANDMPVMRRLRWPRAALRSYLVAVTLIATVPLALLLSYQIFSGVREQQARLDVELQRTATALAQSVERELMSTADALYILAGNDLLLADDVPAFRASLLRPKRLRGSWASAFLIAADGQMLFDTSLSAETPLGSVAERPDFRQMLRVPGLMVSNLQVRAGQPGGLTQVTVPVLKDGQVKYVFGAAIDASSWQALLEDAAPPAEGFLSLFDRDHVLIARTLEPAQAIGKRLPDASIRSIGERERGTHRTVLIEGGEIEGAWQRIGLGQWTVAVHLHAQVFDRAQNAAVWRALLVVAGCLLLGLSLALLLARRLVEPLARLAEADADLPPRSSPVREIELLRERLYTSRAEESRARTHLQSKATEFEALFDGSPIALAFAQDKLCRVVVHNAAMDALFGPSPADDGAPLTVLHEGRPLLRDEQPLQRAARSGEAQPAIELEITAPGRAAKVVLAQAVPLFDAQGRPRGAIGAAADITARKEAEARLLEAGRQLRESQRLVDLAQEAGQVGFFSYDFGSDSLSWSPGQAQLFGLQATGMSLDGWVACIDADHRLHVRQELADLLQRRQERGTFEYRIVPGDGPTRWLSSRVLVHYDDAGAPLRMTGISVDVTEQKQIEQERVSLVAREQTARMEAERANRAKDEFLAMLGHELRNPLGAISSSVEVLGRAPAGSAQADNAREIAVRQTRNLARMLDDVLDVVRVVSGKVSLARHPLDLAGLVQRAVATLQIGGSARDHDIVLALQPAWIDGDATRIEQVVTNLLTNAVKYTPRGSRITLTLTLDGDVCVLQVADNGPGIAPALLPHVFDLFVQGERGLDRRAGGLGVGLTLVQRLVELHGGSVRADSSPAGSVFEIRLPALPTPAPRAGSAAAAGERAGRALHVVLVEDNLDAAQALMASLALDGHTVRHAADGIAGLALLLKEWPDAAILDIGLPGLTGFELALRARAAGFAGVLVAVSGYGQEGDVREALRSGFDAMLVKPVDMPQLRTLLVRSAAN